MARRFILTALLALVPPLVPTLVSAQERPPRILAGFALGTVTGVLAALALGLSRLVRAALDPFLSALYTVPKLAILPLLLLILTG
jgi:ABC-type nitrate/sulfonate/bicarbonate transport system permease component